jgi:beta-lactamase regulating signal transducer with metallopeptidase domain/Tfp pilus assembly protein PilF
MIAHLVSCSVMALIAVVATMLLRGQRAAWRHAILFVALLRFAVPTEWLADAGRRVVRLAPTGATASPLARLLRGPWQATQQITHNHGGPSYGVAYVEYIWLAGIGVCLAVWAWRVRRRIPAVRVASDVEAAIYARAADGFHAELRIVASDMTPGAWGFWRPVVLVPDGLAASLSEAELEAVLAHEIAHVRRHDNLLAAVAHAIVAVFWFHPLVWWMERRMLGERETACDEMVLGQGAGARDYAAGILKVCRMSLAGATGYAGVNGSNLEHRMEHIMSVDLNRRTSRAARALLGMAMAAAALAPAAGGYLRAQEQPVNQQLAAGNEAVRAGNYDQAIEMFQKMLTQLGSDSARGDLYLRLGETYRRKGDVPAAIASLRKAKELLPESTVVSATLALVLDGAGKWQEAEKEYRRTLTLDPSHGVAMNNLAYLLSNSKESVDEALELALRAHEILPDMFEVSDTVGWIYLKKNLADEAVEIFDDLVKKQPQHSTFRYHLALAFLEKGYSASAVEQLKAALDCNPGVEEAAKIHQLLNAAGK